MLGAHVVLTPNEGGVSWAATLPGDDTVFLDGVLYSTVEAAAAAAYAYFQAMSVRCSLEAAMAIACEDSGLITIAEYDRLIASVDGFLDGSLSQAG